jgi:hypothetical protein
MHRILLQSLGFLEMLGRAKNILKLIVERMTGRTRQLTPGQQKIGLSILLTPQ